MAVFSIKLISISALIFRDVEQNEKRNPCFLELIRYLMLNIDIIPVVPANVLDMNMTVNSCLQHSTFILNELKNKTQWSYGLTMAKNSN